MNRSIAVSFLIAVVAAGCATQPMTMEHMAGEENDPKAAPLFDGMGAYTFPVSTDNAMAQRYVTQGMVLAHGFNHAEAARSFRAAAAHDPDCAMAWWGVALVLGPNINAAMDPADVEEAYEASQMAVRKMVHATPVEQALVSAVAYRYDAVAPEDRGDLDLAYAEAMKRVRDAYPANADVAALYAEALMDLHPWDFYLKDKSPQPWTAEVVETIEAALALDPDHPLANHLYIHAVEASATPERGLVAAKRLETLVPNAGHLVHMPSHIYINTGDYHEGSTSNENALKADDAYVAACYAQGIYPLAYHPHNSHFLFACTMLEGRSADCIAAAEKTSDLVSQEHMMMMGFETLQHFAVMNLYAYVRFEKWDAVFAEPKPVEALSYPTAVWHYARGCAYTDQGALDEARAELVPLGRFADEPGMVGATISGINPMASVLRIARADLAARIAAAEGDFEEAIAHLEGARDIEDGMRYNEPPDWYYPIRLRLGSVYLAAGRYGEAEAVYREDLATFPENGWALFGLAQALAGQGIEAEADAVMVRFREAWAMADIALEPVAVAMR